MDSINIGAFIFAAVAAVAAVMAARWEWLDRPHHAWRFKIERERFKEFARSPNESNVVLVDHAKDSFSVTARAFSEGDMVVRNARLRPVGVKPVRSREVEECLRQSTMVTGGDPLQVECRVPSRKRQETEPYVEVVWTTLRPLREHGERLHLRTMEHERWRWKWRSVRPRRRTGEGWWKFRLVRTRGQWVSEHGHPRATIPTHGTF